MGKFGQEIAPDDPPALPLWIDGRASLMMAESFFDVVGQSEGTAGKVLRRVPLYGADEANKVVASSQSVAAAWAAVPPAERAEAFAELPALLEKYADHIAKVLRQEGCKDGAAEVSAALAGVQAALGAPGAAGNPAGKVVAVIAGFDASFAAPLVQAVCAMLDGAVVVLKPSPKSPSGLFMLAELFSRGGLPNGVCNLLQGDEAAVRGLIAHPGVAELRYVGDPQIGATIKAWAGDKPCLLG